MDKIQVTKQWQSWPKLVVGFFITVGNLMANEITRTTLVVKSSVIQKVHAGAVDWFWLPIISNWKVLSVQHINFVFVPNLNHSVHHVNNHLHWSDTECCLYYRQLIAKGVGWYIQSGGECCYFLMSILYLTMVSKLTRIKRCWSK